MREERRFTYQRRSDDSVKQRAAMRGNDFDSIWKENPKRFKPREGKNIVRILPPAWENADHYGFDVYYNRNIGVDNGTYLSLSKMLGKPDPLAEARRQAEAEKDKKLADSLRPVHRIFSYVIDRSAEDEGPQVWDAPWTLDKHIANVAYDEDTNEVVMVDDPENGCDVRFYREGTGMNTKPYDGSKVRLMKPGPLHEDHSIAQRWLDYVQNHPIPGLLNYYDYNHIQGVFNGQVKVVTVRDRVIEEEPMTSQPPFDEDED